MIQLKSASITNPTKSGYSNKEVMASATVTFFCTTEEEQDQAISSLTPMWNQIAAEIALALTGKRDKTG